MLLFFINKIFCIKKALKILHHTIVQPRINYEMIVFKKELYNYKSIKNNFFLKYPPKRTIAPRTAKPEVRKSKKVTKYMF